MQDGSNKLLDTGENFTSLKNKRLNINHIMIHDAVNYRNTIFLKKS